VAGVEPWGGLLYSMGSIQHATQRSLRAAVLSPFHGGGRQGRSAVNPSTSLTTAVDCVWCRRMQWDSPPSSAMWSSWRSTLATSRFASAPPPDKDAVCSLPRQGALSTEPGERESAATVHAGASTPSRTVVVHPSSPGGCRRTRATRVGAHAQTRLGSGLDRRY